MHLLVPTSTSVFLRVLQLVCSFLTFVCCRDQFPDGRTPTDDPTAPAWLVKSKAQPVSSRVLLQQSTGFPLSATLLALLQQQEGDTSCFDTWLAQAREWDSYKKRDKEAGSLLLHLLRTGGCRSHTTCFAGIATSSAGNPLEAQQYL